MIRLKIFLRRWSLAAANTKTKMSVNKNLVLVDRRELAKLKKDLASARAAIAALTAENAQLTANQLNIQSPAQIGGKVYTVDHAPAGSGCGCS